MKAVKKARPAHRKTAHRLNGALFVVICPHRPERPDNGIRRLPGHGPFAPAPPERRKEETGPPSYRSVPLRGSGCPALWDCMFINPHFFLLGHHKEMVLTAVDHHIQKMIDSLLQTHPLISRSVPYFPEQK